MEIFCQAFSGADLTLKRTDLLYTERLDYLKDPGQVFDICVSCQQSGEGLVEGENIVGLLPTFIVNAYWRIISPM